MRACRTDFSGGPEVKASTASEQVRLHVRIGDQQFVSREQFATVSEAVTAALQIEGLGLLARPPRFSRAENGHECGCSCASTADQGAGVTVR